MVTYSGVMQLARGVSVSLSLNTTDDNTFHADNLFPEGSAAVDRSGDQSVGLPPRVLFRPGGVAPIKAKFDVDKSVIILHTADAKAIQKPRLLRQGDGVNQAATLSAAVAHRKSLYRAPHRISHDLRSGVDRLANHAVPRGRLQLVQLLDVGIDAAKLKPCHQANTSQSHS